MPHPHYSPSENPGVGLHAHPLSSPMTGRRQSAGFERELQLEPDGEYTHPTDRTRASSPTYPHVDALASFSRPRELFTIASEVLGVAERLSDGAQRAYWAGWADSVFTQMKMEAELDAWRAPLTAARGRAWLVIGSAPVEEIEKALERGEEGVLGSKEAEEAREGLTVAVGFLERAKGAAGRGTEQQAEPREGGEAEDVSPLLAEALFTLANLTADENKREELYSRAQAEGGDRLALLDLGEDVNLEESRDDAMDES
ncbi:uncharacterized protein FIBRA_08741 [Fibroporia radiculosa]|uniref:Uncharacterized protein n=1 Tax=Fibroporia radiculosa TaxID=599839 RepID=J4H5C0_9APHY|nr:uncharacterized protein FIBRA_08741 [Fibroporia radiculosa]CCM06474.1 predicted protein [Fibroporia radiculosa]